MLEETLFSLVSRQSGGDTGQKWRRAVECSLWNTSYRSRFLTKTRILLYGAKEIVVVAAQLAVSLLTRHGKHAPDALLSFLTMRVSVQRREKNLQFGLFFHLNFHWMSNYSSDDLMGKYIVWKYPPTTVTDVSKCCKSVFSDVWSSPMHLLFVLSMLHLFLHSKPMQSSRRFWGSTNSVLLNHILHICHVHCMSYFMSRWNYCVGRHLLVNAITNNFIHSSIFYALGSHNPTVNTEKTQFYHRKM